MPDTKVILKKALLVGKSLYRKIVKLVLRDEEHGLSFNCRTSSDCYVFNEIFGKEDAYRRDRIAPLIREGVVVEVGAHKGFFTLLAATQAKKVIAFEPDQENFRYLSAEH